MSVSAAAVLLELVERGIAVDVVDGQIRCRHAAGALSPGLVARVREHREEILALLADPDAFRLAMAMAIFDAEPVDENELHTALEPTRRLPADSLATHACTAVGPGARDLVGAKCGQAKSAASHASDCAAGGDHAQLSLFAARTAP